jgi:hypothetical protein
MSFGLFVCPHSTLFFKYDEQDIMTELPSVTRPDKFEINCEASVWIFF